MNAPIETGVKLPDTLDGFKPSMFKGTSPARRDLIEGRLPRGKLVVLAGEGDIGKSWLLLSLFEAINDGALSECFGGRVVQRGLPCVFLSGEDDFATVDTRLRTIRTTTAQPAEHGALVTAPDIGTMHLVRRDYDNTIKPTDVFTWLDKQLQAQRDTFGELGFLAIDTLSTFLPINANAPEEVQGAYAYLTHLATKHDVCIILTHHVAKGSEAGTRAAIRGSTAIVDGARAAYNFFRLPEDKAQAVRDALGLDGEVLRLQIVKNNLGLRRDPVTFIRGPDGTLGDVSGLLAMNEVDPEAALVKVVAEALAQGQRLTKTGKAGLFASRSLAWPGGLGTLPKAKLEGLADACISKGLLQVAEGGALLPG